MVLFLTSQRSSLHADSAYSGKSSTLSMNDDFGTIFCEAYQVSGDDFCCALLIVSARWHARPIIRLIAAIIPGIFSDDFQHLEALRKTKTRNEFVSKMMSLENYNQHHLARWRKLLGIRASIGKLSKLAILLRHYSSSFPS